MFRVGICDDSAAARERVRLELQKLLRQDDGAFFEFSSGEGLLRWLESHRGELELLLLDVELRGMDGMETARKLRELDRELPLAFVTGYDRFVFDGYGVDALGYLLKPVDPARLAQVVALARQRLEAQASEQFVIRSAGSVFRLPQREILYFRSDRRRVTAVTRQREYVFYARLDDVASRLGPAFVRVHQRYLVNAGAVTAVEGEQVVLPGARLPISRRCRAEALLRLARAMTEEMT